MTSWTRRRAYTAVTLAAAAVSLTLADAHPAYWAAWGVLVAGAVVLTARDLTRGRQ